MSSEKIAYRVVIEGRVTGVGFRWSALNYAENLPSLCGYIRNSSYSAVEAVIQGDETHVKLMLEWLKHGPSFARVESIKINPQPISNSLESFHIR